MPHDLRLIYLKGDDIMSIKNMYNLFKTFLKVKKEVNNMEKSGVKTSEFWLTALSIGIVLWQALSGMIPPQTVAIITGILAGVYALARAIVKATKSTKDDEFFAKVEQIVNDKLNKKIDSENK